jgi:hypothetical protein
VDARRECCLDLVSRLFDQGQAGGAWRQDRYLPFISTATTVLVTTGPIEENIHCTFPGGECLTHREALILTGSIRNEKKKKRTEPSAHGKVQSNLA